MLESVLKPSQSDFRQLRGVSRLEKQNTGFRGFLLAVMLNCLDSKSRMKIRMIRQIMPQNLFFNAFIYLLQARQ